VKKTKGNASSALEPFIRQRTALLTTYRRDGTPVGTPVSVAVDNDRAFVRTYDRAWKVKRLRNNPLVEIAPSTVLGRATGPAIPARARLLDDDEAGQAATALGRKNRVLQGVMVPLYHRLRGYRTLHYELTPIESEEVSSPSGPAGPPR
jgi:PPOX class probable F420-dependent enzyme